MRSMMRNAVIAMAALALVAMTGCKDDGGEGEEDSSLDTEIDPGTDPEMDPEIDAVTDPDVDTADVPGDEVTEEYATIWIAVDDTAQQTYSDGQLVWHGEFNWDDATNTITYDEYWAGPYPPLYDDGPVSSGGHEAEGQTSGDHIFSTQVRFLANPDAETVFRYGISDENGWIWVGDNSSFTVPAGSTATFEATGMTIPAFGDIDLLLTLDTSSLATGFSPPSSEMTVVSNLNAWQELEMVDDGTAGDETSGDGIYTLQWSEHDGGHYGLLRVGDTIIFTISIDLIDYRIAGAGAHEGVAVFTDYETAGTWTEEVIFDYETLTASDTAIVVGSD